MSKTVFTNGCFDILHAGHVTYLEAARQQGDRLVVGLNSDQSIKTIKGSKRPIIPQNYRKQLLEALSCVDEVIIFEEKTPIRLIEQLQPDIYIKGGDYTEATLPETPIVKGYGGQVKILPFVPGCSTSQIIEKIKSVY